MRLFVAIELNDSVRSALVGLRRRLQDWDQAVRWTPEGRMHLTLKFLGETPDPSVAAIGKALTDGAAALPGFHVTLEGCGGFPPKGTVRVLWVGVKEPTGALAGCAEAIEASLEPLGFPREPQGFSPHVTLGRVREGRQVVGLREALGGVKMAPLSQSVSSIVLMSSVLSREGPTYSMAARASLGGRAKH